MEIYGKYIESRRNHERTKKYKYLLVNDNDRACALSFFLAYGAGLYHSAGSIVKGCERGLGALAHGNYNLLIGHR